MDRKTTMLNPKLVEDFYATDKNNLNFWIARTEKYSKDKVVNSCRRVGLDQETAQVIADRVDNYVDNRMKMSDVRPLIYGMLQKVDSTAADKFRAGETFVRTSYEEFVRFNKNFISKSLVKEAEISEQLANQIAGDVEHFIRSSKLQNISSSLIRELSLIHI